MKFSHFTDTIILFGDEFDNFQTKLIRVGHNLHLKLGVQVFFGGGRSKRGAPLNSLQRFCCSVISRIEEGTIASSCFWIFKYGSKCFSVFSNLVAMLFSVISEKVITHFLPYRKIYSLHLIATRKTKTPCILLQGIDFKGFLKR